ARGAGPSGNWPVSPVSVVTRPRTSADGTPSLPAMGATSSKPASPSTASIRTAARRSPSATTSARSAPRTGKPSRGRASITGNAVPRRFMTPTSGAGAPGTGVMASSTTTSRASTTSTANDRPPRRTRQARRAGERSSTARARLDPTASVDKAPHRRQQLIGRERLREVVVGALTLAPGAVALLVLRRDQHHRHRLGLLVALEGAQQLVPVALGHHDVQ